MAGFSFDVRGQNYTGFLTRSIVYSAALVAFLAATGMTLASIVVPNWISYDTTTNQNTKLHYTYGLHRRCTNTDIPPSIQSQSLHCTQFPRFEDCHGEDRYFCSMWRSVGFLMSFAVVIEGMTIAAFVILVAGGKQRREQGWGFLAILTVLAAFVQAIGMALMAYLYENDDRFFDGWYLDKSWSMCTASWIIQGVCAIVITMAAILLPTEGGYELIPDSSSA